jgi:hypothetical protein
VRSHLEGQLEIMRINDGVLGNETSACDWSDRSDGMEADAKV